MQFTVKYRSPKGSIVDEVVEAENRGECLAICKQRGITPLSVKEGKSSALNSKRQIANSSAKIIKWIVALTALASIGIVAWFVSQKTPAEGKVPVEKARPKGLVKEVVPAKPRPAVQSVTEPVEKKAPPSSPKERSLRDSNLTDKERIELYEKKLVETPLPKESTNRLFRTSLEQVMGWVFTTELGDMPPPLPPIPDYDLVHLEEILSQKTTIHKTDTDKQAEEKDTVDYVKKELKKFVDKGGDPEDFLKFYHDELKSAYQERSMAQEQIMKIMREDPAVAMEYMKEVNESLANKGIKKVVLPERTLMRMGVDPKLLKGENKQ